MGFYRAFSTVQILDKRLYIIKDYPERMDDASLTLVDRGRIRADKGNVIDGYTMGSAQEPNPDHEMTEFVVWCAVVEAGDRTFLVDTGPPSDPAEYWPDPLYNAFEPYDAAEHDLDSDLEEVGYSLDDIDAVVMSHLHLDHAGALDRFEGTDTPVYTHAEEIEFAFRSAKTNEGSIAYLAADFDGDYAWQLVHEETHTLAPGFQLLHLPGHTPGLLGARIETTDGTVVIAGDEAYVAANYEDGVPLGPGLLWSEPEWRRSRRRLREIERRTEAHVVLGHDLDDFEAGPTHWG